MAKPLIIQNIILWFTARCSLYVDSDVSGNYYIFRFKVETIWCSETSVTTHPTTRRHDTRNRSMISHICNKKPKFYVRCLSGRVSKFGDLTSVKSQIILSSITTSNGSEFYPQGRHFNTRVALHWSACNQGPSATCKFIEVINVLSGTILHGGCVLPAFIV